jgi:uncharacterized protein (TIGR02117 family)
VRKLFVTLLFVLLLLSLGNGGCAWQKPPPPVGLENVVIYVVGHDWHTGLVIPLAAISTEHYLPVRDVYNQYQYIEVSWGDKDFFQSREDSLYVTLKAALLPTDSVLHVVGFNGPVTKYFPTSKIIKLTPTKKDFLVLCEFISNSFDYDHHNEMQRLGPDLYGDSQFYKANEKYYLPKTCNVWTARALNSAGYPISPYCTFQVDSLLNQAKQYGERLR